MKNSKNLLIAESNIGYHSMNNKCIREYALVFIPKIVEEKGKYKAVINLENNETMKEILEEYSSGNCRILLGFDLDENGELMAQALRDFLLTKQVNKNDLIRMPLTEDGYIAMCDFLDISDYLRYRYLQQKLTNLTKKNKSKLNIRQILSLKYLYMRRAKTIHLEENTEINLQGTSTFTYLLGESNS